MTNATTFTLDTSGTIMDRPFPWMSNRRVAAQEPEYLQGSGLTHVWVVCDRDSSRDGLCQGPAFSYGSAECAYRISTDVGGWIIVSDRGRYLRSDGTWEGDRRRVRRFRTPLAAAIAAEEAYA